MITAQMDVWDVRCGSILVCFNNFKECFGTRYEGCHACKISWKHRIMYAKIYMGDGIPLRREMVC